jgi:glycosyltransferase involved in cell wall biosynthesis
MSFFIVNNIITPYRVALFNEMHHQNPDAHFVFLRENESCRSWDIEGEKKEIKFEYSVLNSLLIRKAKALTSDFFLNHGISKTFRKASAILVFGYNYPGYWQILFYAKWNRIPLIVFCESTLSDDRRTSRLKAWLRAFFFSQCRMILVPGQSSKLFVESVVGDKRVVTAPNSVSDAVFNASFSGQAKELSKEKAHPVKTFLYVGRLSEEKGVDVLIQAFLMGVEGARLVLVGSGPLDSKLKSFAEGDERILFRGYLQKEALPELYHHSHCLVVPSRSEPWGLVINEAMQCGCPVISSHHVGAALDLVNEETGWIFSAGDSSDLWRVLKRSAKQTEEERLNMKEAVLHKIAEYTPKEQASKFNFAFEECVKEV